MVKYGRLGVLILIAIQISGCLLQDLGDEDLGSLEDGGGGDLVEKPLGKCPPVPTPPHAVVVSRPKDTSISSVVKMKCSRGYKKVGGSANRVCQPTLKWTGKDIVCEAVECPKLVIKNALANTTARTFGTVVGFACRNGTLRQPDEGDTVRRCQANQLWTGSDIACLPPQCPKLKVPRSTVASTRNRFVGVVVKLHCVRGTSRVAGDKQVTCGQDQKWKGKTLICKPPGCKPLKPVPHSKKDTGNRRAGAIVRLTCEKGYKGSNGDTYTTMCDRRTLKWTRLSFKCTKIGGKKRGRKHKGKGKRKRSGHKRKGGRRKKHGKECRRTHPYYVLRRGASVKVQKVQGLTVSTMKCLPGWFKLSGQEKRVCRKQGETMEWSSGPPLACRAGGEVAEGKPLHRSSSIAPSSYHDCPKTTGEEAPWLFVDLKAEYPIQSVEIHKFVRGKTNRKLARSLKDFTISVSNTKPGKGTYKANKKETCLNVRRTSRHRNVQYKCKSIKVGRYVVISMKKKFKLGLCKIMVWPKASIAMLKLASQSSTFGSYSARLAVDGDLSSSPKSNSCSMTSYQNNPWWVVDLKGKKTVSRVILHHKSDRTVTEQLANFTVSVTDKKPSGEQYQPAEKDVCYSQKEAVVPGSVTSIQCTPTKKGRFIVVSRAGVGVMSLCEVLVYN